MVPVLYRQPSLDSMVKRIGHRSTPLMAVSTAPFSLLAGLALLLGGCASGNRVPAKPSEITVRVDCGVMDGRTGSVLTWDMLVAQLDPADVIVIGEQHDDATGHAVQLALVEDLLTDGRGALAMEMLERDEQALIDDYRDGIIDTETFAKLTESTDWAGSGSWAAWYQPCVDAAIDQGAAVVAANAPRRYVRTARIDGWTTIDTLSGPRAQLVDRPDTPITGSYRERFFELMGGHGDGQSPDPENMNVVESFFRSQQVWDATMAASVSTALETAGPPVILIVGRFHSDYEGGTVSQIRRHHPGATIRTISLEPACETVELNPEEPQADFVICTTP